MSDVERDRKLLLQAYGLRDRLHDVAEQAIKSHWRGWPNKSPFNAALEKIEGGGK